MISLEPLKQFATSDFSARMATVERGLGQDQLHAAILADRVETAIAELDPHRSVAE